MNETLLVGLTSLFNFIFLIISLWLGLYILLHNPRSRAALLTSLTLWSVAGSFLNTLTFVHTLTREGTLPWWWGWSVAFAVPFWFHLSVTLLPGEQTDRQRTFVIMAYLMTLNLVAMEAYTPLIFQGTTEALPSYYSYQEPGRLFPLYGLYLVIVPLYSLWNFRRGWQFSTNLFLRHPYALLQIASLVAVVAGVYGSFSIWLQLDAPILITTLLLGSGVTLLAYSVIRWNALVQGFLHRRDMLFSAIATGMIVAGYLLVAVISNLAFHVPFIAYIFLVCFAIVTHSLYDFGLAFMDKRFSTRRGYSKLRASLRELVRTGYLEQDLHEGLRILLQSLCETYKICTGVIVLFGEDVPFVATQMDADVVSEWKSYGQLAQDELQVIADPENPDRGAALVAPLFHGGSNLGFMVLGPAPVVQMFQEKDLDFIEDFTVRVAGIVHAAALRKDAVIQIETIAQQFKQRERDLRARMRQALDQGAREPRPLNLGEGELHELVEDALRNIGDYSFLGQHELVQLELVPSFMDAEKPGQVTHIDRGRALHLLLLNCIEKLKPQGEKPDPPTRDWRAYVILHDCYVGGMSTREVMNALYISEATFHRIRRRAVNAVAKAIAEMERKTSWF